MKNITIKAKASRKIKAGRVVTLCKNGNVKPASAKDRINIPVGFAFHDMERDDEVEYIPGGNTKDIVASGTTILKGMQLDNAVYVNFDDPENQPCRR